MKTLLSREVAATDTQEAGSLARALVSAYRSRLDFHKREYLRSAPEALTRAEEDIEPDLRQRALEGPCEDTSWDDLQRLYEENPVLMLMRWQEMKQQALEELQNGHQAACTVEGFNSTPWRRAQFLAVHEELTVDWQPRDGVERLLINTLAQSYTAMMRWLEILSHYETARCGRERQQVDRIGEWDTPRVTEHQAVEQAAAMVDRFNKLMVRTLRAMRDLRRYNPTVVVQNAGQVNVAQQQVNVNGREG
jgi:hypothetical protein